MRTLSFLAASVIAVTVSASHLPVNLPTCALGVGAYSKNPPSNVLVHPRLVKRVRPRYTIEAMHAKIQGHVVVQFVVQKNGTVGDVRVLDSLDETFGLDREAVSAAKLWRFTPASVNGQPVDCLLTPVELTFKIF